MMILILVLCSIIFFTFVFLNRRQSRGKKIKTLKSPPRLPLIGNLHQLSRHPHQSLCSLSHQYGPLMLLQFGRVPVLVVSTAEAARDVLKTHDRIVAGRPRSKAFKKLLYDGHDVATAPYGEYWRQMKSVCVLHLFSNKMVRSFRDVREEEINLMLEKIQESSSSPVNLSKLLSSLTNDVICRVALGRKYGGETNFKELMEKLSELLGTFSVGSYVPWLSWIDWIRGLDREIEKTANDFDEFFERVVEDHVDGDGDKTDFVHVLLAIQKEKSLGFEIDRRSIKAIIMNVFVGGTDTSYTLMEWAMTELLLHRECLKKLQEEVSRICKEKWSVSEEDVKDMSYLKAVIKETLRLHPPLPLLVPHESTHDVRLKDNYHIQAGTQIMINVWAIGRETATWGPDAEEFRPERHLDSSVDFRGQNFELIPFGAGRRICPAISFAVTLNEVVLANLVHRFDWRLPVVVSTKDQTDLAESAGTSVHRMFPLYAIASSSSSSTIT